MRLGASKSVHPGTLRTSAQDLSSAPAELAADYESFKETYNFTQTGGPLYALLLRQAANVRVEQRLRWEQEQKEKAQQRAAAAAAAAAGTSSKAPVTAGRKRKAPVDDVPDVSSRSSVPSSLPPLEPGTQPTSGSAGGPAGASSVNRDEDHDVSTGAAMNSSSVNDAGTGAAGYVESAEELRIRKAIEEVSQWVIGLLVNDEWTVMTSCGSLADSAYLVHMHAQKLAKAKAAPPKKQKKGFL